MNPIVAPKCYEKCKIDDESSVGFSGSQVFAFIRSAMKASAEKGCSCAIGWFILEIASANETQEKRNRNAIKRGKAALVEMATTLLVRHVGKEKSRYNNF